MFKSNANDPMALVYIQKYLQVIKKMYRLNPICIRFKVTCITYSEALKFRSMLLVKEIVQINMKTQDRDKGIRE